MVRSLHLVSRLAWLPGPRLQVSWDAVLGFAAGTAPAGAAGALGDRVGAEAPVAASAAGFAGAVPVAAAGAVAGLAPVAGAAGAVTGVLLAGAGLAAGPTLPTGLLPAAGVTPQLGWERSGATGVGSHRPRAVPPVGDAAGFAAPALALGPESGESA